MPCSSRAEAGPLAHPVMPVKGRAGRTPTAGRGHSHFAFAFLATSVAVVGIANGGIMLLGAPYGMVRALSRTAASRSWIALRSWMTIQLLDPHPHRHLSLLVARPPIQLFSEVCYIFITFRTSMAQHSTAQHIPCTPDEAWCNCPSVEGSPASVGDPGR